MLLSASNLHRFKECPSSVLLPREPFTQSSSAQKGTNIHEFVSLCVQHGPEKALELMPDRYQGKAAVARINFSEIVADMVNMQTEIAVYWNVDEDKWEVLGSNIGRNYYQLGAADWNYVGSIDIVGQNSVTGDIVVADIKTGLQEVQAEGCDQLELLGYIVAKVKNLDRVETRIIKIHDSGAVRTNSFVLDAAKLKSVERELIGTYNKVQYNLREYTKGHATDYSYTEEGCKWCPCRSSCPMYARETGR